MYTYIRIFLNIIFSVRIMLFVLCFLDWPFGHWTSSWCAVLWGRPRLLPPPEEAPRSSHSANIRFQPWEAASHYLCELISGAFLPEREHRSSCLMAFPLALYSVSLSSPKVTWISSAAFLDYLTSPSCLIALYHTFMLMPLEFYNPGLIQKIGQMNYKDLNPLHSIWIRMPGRVTRPWNPSMREADTGGHLGFVAH